MAEQLEALISDKERLLRDVSHELRSPLTRLQLSLALARRKSPDAEAEHSRIEREIERLDQMVGEIIRFSRIQNGVTDLAWEPVQLAGLIEAIVMMLILKPRLRTSQWYSGNVRISTL